MWRIALRNVLRNRRRSVLSVAVIAIGVSALMLANGYSRFTYWGLDQTATYQYGHLQIAERAYWANQGDMSARLMNGATVAAVESVLRVDPEVDTFFPMLTVTGLIGTAANSTVFMAEATPAGVEYGSVGTAVAEGRRLLASDQESIVVGARLAEALGVGLGEWLTVFTSTLDGAYNAGNARLVGLIRTGMAEADQRLAAMPLEDARRLLNTDGADRVVVLLKGDPGRQDATLEPVAQRLRAGLQEAGLDSLELKTRADLATFVQQVRSLYGAIFAFLTTVIFGVVLVSVLESLTLSFFERVREMGTVLAMGTSRGQLFMQLVTEGAALGVLGGILGMALGWATGTLVNQSHITYVPPTMTEAVPLAVQLDWATGTWPAAVGLVAAVLSAVYPAWIATRLQVVEALRHV